MNLTLDQYKKLAAENFEIIPLVEDVFADMETPVTIFLKARSRGNSFILESVEHKEELGRYSFIGFQTREVSKLENDVLYINDQALKCEGNPLRKVNEVFLGKKVYRDATTPPFLGGLVGYLSYESVRYFDKIQFSDKSGLDLPDFAFFWVDQLISMDNFNQKLQLIVLTYPNSADPEKAYEEGRAKLAAILDTLKNEKIDSLPEPKETGEVKLSSNMKKQDFYDKVKKCQEYIKAGDAFQIVLSQRFSAQTGFSPFSLYRSLRSINPSPYMYFLDYGDFQVVGASPEVMVKLDHENNILLKPIAGTRPRGKNKPEDLDLERELMQDEKERAEHIMLVDLGRNDIGRISFPGTVKVSELMKVERYSHVMHIVSTVVGKVSDQFNWVDALEATFPAGTLSGAPKIRAMEIIDELEPTKRGPYGGAVLYVSADGVLDSCITIRTLICQEGKIYGQAGAGIVFDSDPEKEYIETVNKVRSLFSSVYKLRQKMFL